MLLCVNEFIKRYVKNWSCESGFVVENALVCVLWSEKNSPKQIDLIFGHFFKKHRRETRERKENESIQLFLEKEALKSLSRAAEAKRRKQKERTCFFAAFVLPSSAGVQVFHLRTQRSISICSRGFLVYEEKTTNRVSPLLGTKSQCEGEGVVSEKKSCLRFVSCHFSCAREKKSRIERNEVDNPRTIIRRRLDDRGGTQTAFSPREHRFEYEHQR